MSKHQNTELKRHISCTQQPSHRRHCVLRSQSLGKALLCRRLASEAHQTWKRNPFLLQYLSSALQARINIVLTSKGEIFTEPTSIITEQLEKGDSELRGSQWETGAETQGLAGLEDTLRSSDFFLFPTRIPLDDRITPTRSHQALLLQVHRERKRALLFQQTVVQSLNQYNNEVFQRKTTPQPVMNHFNGIYLRT